MTSTRLLGTSLRDERGIVTILVAFILVAILGIAAILVDIGNARQSALNLQSASDAGSLAGAQQLATSQLSAQTYAADYAFDSANQPRGGTATCPAGKPISSKPVPAAGVTVCYRSTSGSVAWVTTPYAGNANQINVIMCQTIRTTLARAINIDTTHPCKSSTALFNPPTGNCVLCVMDTNPNDSCPFSVGGNGNITVVGNPPGPIAVNSPNPPTDCGGGSTKVTSSGGITWAGCHQFPTCPVKKGTWNPLPSPGPVVNDPLANVNPPSVTTAGSCSPASGGNETCQPGVYTSSNPIKLVHGTTTLAAGIYVVESTISMQNQNTLLGTGVMIYFTCPGYTATGPNPNLAPCKGSAGAGFGGNNGVVTLSSAPVTPPSTYGGLLIFADRGNTANLMGDNGNITYTLKGTIYGLTASITLGGTAGQMLDSRLIIGKLSLQGTPNINENYSDQFQGLTTIGGVALIG